ncbi:MAG: enoyl-[acyl-carrier-protein] reductase FabK [Dehalococcoidia bacterium]|nr:enoyl-[acyl-carrier-protein] reductase FabK [Dehalococcoidia bacterium]
MLRTPVCDILGIEYPVIQGGMAWVATSELAAAVSEAGGLGTIGSGNAPGDWVRQQIRATRERTSKPFAVNVLMVSPFVKEVLDVVVEEKVPVVAFGAGQPGVFFPRLKEAGIKIMPVVSAVALAKRLQRSGADVIVAEGMESGGHIGETTTMALVPQVVNAVQVPVIAAGGIADGRGLAAALALGAQGIQMGTRFVCSNECIGHTKYKEQIVKAGDRSTVITGRATGHPVRCLENKLARQFIDLEKQGAPVEEYEKLGVGKMPLGVIQGDIENGSLMAGQIAGMICQVKPVRDIIIEIMAEAEAVIGRMADLRKGPGSA